VAKAKQASTEQSGSYKCGHCGGLGHNARTCPDRAGKKAGKKKATKPSPKKAPAKKPPKKQAKGPAPKEPKPEPPEKVFDFDDGEDMQLPDAPPPGAKLNTPKRKREKTKAEAAFWAATEKKLAPGAVAPAGELALQIPRISTGNFGLDVALYGGWPQGRVCRPWGMPKSGKTGTCINTVATYQREHCSECFQRKCDCKDRDVPEVVWVDAENRMNSMLHWPQAHGVNLDCMRVLCPPTGQNVVDFVDHIIREQKVAKVGLIIVDSLAHIVSQDVINKPTLDGVTVGRNAHLLNTAWQKWTSASMSLGIQNERKPTILCINQIRHKVGQNFGSPETMPGGLGQEFATTVDVRFGSGPMTYVVWDEKKRTWVAKQKKYKSTFKPPPDAAPDFVTISYRVTASGHSPPGRYGEFNYWLKSTHGHRCGDPDNGLQLWNYCKRYDLVEVEGQTKRLFGHEARTFDELKELFRGDQKAHKKAWRILMKRLVA
jgi:RecA/RadA recombinase